MKSHRFSLAQVQSKFTPSRFFTILSACLIYAGGMDLCLADNSSTPSPNSSMASNYGKSSTVNKQTGQAEVEIAAFTLKGKSAYTDINIGISWVGQQQSFFGMPQGFALSIPYIEQSSNEFILNESGGGIYYLSGNLGTNVWPSGIKYVTANSIKMLYGVEYNGKSYAYQLLNMHGDSSYFGEDGLLYFDVDRFGNSVQYAYTNINENLSSSITNSYLSKIIDSYNQITTFSISPIEITAPDQRKIKYQITSDNITVTDLTGLVTTYTYNNTNGITKVAYDSGGTKTYVYEENILKYSYGNVNSAFSAVVEEISDPGNGQTASTVKYCYSGNPDMPNPQAHNFTGYPMYSYAGASGDNLMQNGYNGYNYTTTVTAPAPDGVSNILTETTYNYLHLPVSIMTYQNSISNSNLISSKQMTYNIKDSNGMPIGNVNELPKSYTVPTQTITNMYSNGTSYAVYTTDVTSNDNSQPLTVKNYVNGVLLSETVHTYYPNGAPDYASVETVTDYDYISNTIIYDQYSSLAYSDSTAQYSYNLQAQQQDINASPMNETYWLTTDFVLDSMGRQISKTLSFTDGHGKSIVSSTSYSVLDSNGLMTVTSTDPNGNSSEQIVNVQNGWTISKTDPMGYITNYAYDSAGLIITQTNPDSSYLTKDNSNPNKEVVTSSNTLAVTKELDGFGRVVKKYDNINPVNVTYGYNTGNKLSSKISSYTGANPFSHEESYTYDVKGRQLTETDYLGHVTKHTYTDSAISSITVSFNGIDTTLNTFNPATMTSTSTDLLTNVSTEQISNTHKKPLSSTLKIGDTIDMSSLYYYNVSDEKIKYSLNAPGGTDAVSTWELDVLGKTLSRNTQFTGFAANVSDAVSTDSSETYKYDNMGKITTLTNQISQIENFSYNADESLSCDTDFAGSNTQHTYDSMKRLLSSVTTSTAADTVIEVKNIYYPSDPKNGGGYAYDGKLKQKSLIVNGTSVDTIGYTYTSKGLLESMNYDGGAKSVTLAYDDLNRVSSVTDCIGTVTSYAYDPLIITNITSDSAMYNGNLIGEVSYTYIPSDTTTLLGTGSVIQELKYGNGVTVNYTYYSTGEQKLQSAATINGTINLSTTSFTYNDKGEIYTETITSSLYSDVNHNNTKTYTYNDVSELITCDAADSANNLVSTTSYIYDIYGNVAEKNILRESNIKENSIYRYNLINQLVQLNDGSDTIIFSYDTNGNMLFDGTNTYSYNILNQMTEFTGSSGESVLYSYNANSLRKSKQYKNGSNAINYFYNHKNSIINETDINSNTASYLDRIVRSVIDSEGTINNQEYLIMGGKDVIGTTKDGKTLDNSYQYTAYGEEVDLSTGTELGLADFDINDNPFKYSGYYMDSESGLYYLQARYYSPALMRFISMDTYDLMNRYMYGNGNPIGNVDPTGHNAITSWFAAGLSIACTIGMIVAPEGMLPLLFLVGSEVMPIINFVAAAESNNVKGMISNGLLIASQAAGLGSAQSTAFQWGKDAVAASKALETEESFEVVGKGTFFKNGAFKARYLSNDGNFMDSTDPEIMQNLAKVNKGKKYITISSTLSQSLSGASVGVSSSNGKAGQMAEFGALGFVGGAIGGFYYGAMTNILNPEKLTPEMTIGQKALKIWGYAWKGGLRTGGTGMMQDLGATVIPEAVNHEKINWTNFGIGVATGVGFGAFSGVSNAFATANTASKLWKGIRYGYLFMKTPFLAGLQSNPKAWAEQWY